VAVGTPEQVAANDASWTGRYLKDVLAKHAARAVAAPSEVKPARTRKRALA
jgi:excinuclease ABC subunit A